MRASSTRSPKVTCNRSRSNERNPAARSAGASERGRHFATKYADLVFTVIRTGGLEECRAHVQTYHRLAREEYGREVRVWTVANIVQGETEKAARDFYR